MAGTMSATQKHIRFGGVLVAVSFLVSCPGYLEEGAWIADGGRITGGSVPPPAPGAGDAGKDAPGPGGGTGGASGAGAIAGTGGTGANYGTGGTGGGGGSVAPMGGRPADGGVVGDGRGSDSAGAAPPVPFCATGAEITSKILMPKCAGCHGNNNPAAGLNLAAPNAKMRLLNVNARCAGKTLVVDSPRVGGHLFDKLAGAVMGCGQRMPLMRTPLSAEEIQCLRDWIKPEAPPPPPDPPPNGVPLCATGPEILSKILMPKCGVCHGAQMPAGNLDLVTGNVKAKLLNVPSRACNNRPLIFDSPDVGGHFFDKLAGAVPGCGNQMPFGGITPLSAAEVQCLKDWIKPPPPPVQ